MGPAEYPWQLPGRRRRRLPAAATEVELHLAPVGPVVQGRGRELGAVVTLNDRWEAAPPSPSGRQHPRDVGAAERGGGLQRHAFARVDVDEGEHAGRPVDNCVCEAFNGSLRRERGAGCAHDLAGRLQQHTAPQELRNPFPCRLRDRGRVHASPPFPSILTR